jgi:choline dehydrogenase
MTRQSWDYVVVGAGSAGCVVANRLSASGGKRVLLLEAGPRATVMMKVLGAAKYLDLARYDWGYYSQPDATRRQRRERWLRGRGVGGTSSINGTNYVRGSREDYDRWAALGNEGWAARQVMPLFQSLERCREGFRRGVDYAVRGRSGSLHIREVHDCHPLTEIFIQAAVSAGHAFNHDYNGASQAGIGYAQLNQRRGLRCSSADAFLNPVLDRKNLQLLTEAHVHRLLITQGRVTGVRYEKAGCLHEALADEVILCAGAINTPKLLMLSGIGPRAALEALGIVSVLDRPAVGRNLMEHALIRVVGRVDTPTYNPTGGLTHDAALLAKFLLTGQGPLASVVEAQGFLKTACDLQVPDIQIHFMPVGMGYAIDNPYYVLPYPSFTVLINKSHPTSRGQIRLASADPMAPPLIEPNMLADERDVATLVEGVRVVREILARTAGIVAQEVHPGETCTEPAAIAEYIRAHTEGAYHPAGTCRMGADADAVVSPDLRVRGIENLWIADASVMPELISGNINAACMMIGEKLGRALHGGPCR